MVKEYTLDEPFLAVQDLLGEGPVWDSNKKILYWVDIKKSLIHALDPKTLAHAIDDYSSTTKSIGCVAISKTGTHLIAGFGTRTSWVEVPTLPSTSGDAKIEKEKKAEDAGFAIEKRLLEDGKDGRKGTNRLNDGACDAKGRLWIGSMGHDEKAGKGSLYRLDPDGSSHVIEERIGCSNGLGWSPDNKTMYYIDSALCLMWAYDYDLETGTPSNRRVFVDAQPYHGGAYDGLCMDSEGYVWVCRWGDSKVVRLSPQGEVDTIVHLPKALNVTCCVFGGDDMQDLFITTASALNTKPELQPEFHQSGDLFKVRIEGVKGVERHRYFK